jgi:hypothetical protein
MPNALAQFINFSSLVFVAFTDFLVPFSLYVLLMKRDAKAARARRVRAAHASPSCQGDLPNAVQQPPVSAAAGGLGASPPPLLSPTPTGAPAGLEPLPTPSSSGGASSGASSQPSPNYLRELCDDEARTLGSRGTDLHDDEREPSFTSLALASVPPHHAFPDACDYAGAPRHKSALAALLGGTLTTAALVAIYLSVTQGTYSFDARTCALVGD